MVAFATEHAPQNPESERKNRARKFFLSPLETRRGDRLRARHPRREKADTFTKTASGMSYYGFRFYSPSMGRFLNRDPINEPGSQLVRDVKKGGSVREELNLYAFVGNDSVNQWDYLGLSGSLSGCAREIMGAANENRRNRANPEQAPVNYRHVHCEWSCRIAAECGEGVARELGILNELFEDLVNKGGEKKGTDHDDESQEEATMQDFASNEMGIGCARKGKACCNSCCNEKVGGRYDAPLEDDLFP